MFEESLKNEEKLKNETKRLEDELYSEKTKTTRQQLQIDKLVDENNKLLNILEHLSITLSNLSECLEQ